MYVNCGWAVPAVQIRKLEADASIAEDSAAALDVQQTVGS